MLWPRILRHPERGRERGKGLIITSHIELVYSLRPEGIYFGANSNMPQLRFQKGIPVMGRNDRKGWATAIKCSLPTLRDSRLTYYIHYQNDKEVK